MNRNLLLEIQNYLFENNHVSEYRLLQNDIFDSDGNINISNLRISICHDAFNFREMLDYKGIELSTVLDELERNYKIAAEMGIVYSVYFYCLDLGFFLPDMLKAFAKNGLLKTYCALFLSQFRRMVQSK